MGKNWDKIILEAYTIIYDNSCPKVSFTKLMEEATIDKDGRKNIPFMDYTIEESKFEEIIDNISKKYNLKSIDRTKFRNTMLLGATPKFKKVI